MGKQLWSNNAQSTMAGSLAVGGTTLTVASGTGSKFPTPNVPSNEFFEITVYTKDEYGVWTDVETMTVINRVGDTFTLQTRDYDGSVGVSGGRSYDGTTTTVYVEVLWTAESAHALEVYADSVASAAVSGQYTTPETGDLNTLLAGGTDHEIPMRSHAGVVLSPVYMSWTYFRRSVVSAIGIVAAGITGKTTPVDGDFTIIGDSAASNATKKLTLTNLWLNYLKGKADGLYRLKAVSREKATGDLVLYVRPDGNDANDGSANDSAHAKLTIQAAWDTLSDLDLSTYTGTIRVGDGTYTAGLSVNKMPVGGSGTFLTGNTTTPANVVISVTGTPINVTTPVTLSIDGVKLQTSGSAQSLVLVNHPGAVIAVGRNEYGACSNGHHINVLAGYLTRIASGHTYTISSTSSQTHITAGSNAAKVNIATQTVTLSGTPAFTAAFVNAAELANVNLLNNTYSGSATGKRYNVTLNAVVNTYGATLPGDTAGTTATGGQYA